jgi:hypothetical protein
MGGGESEVKERSTRVVVQFEFPDVGFAWIASSRAQPFFRRSEGSREDRQKLARDPRSTPARMLAVRSGQALGPLVKRGPSGRRTEWVFKLNHHQRSASPNSFL